MVWHNYLQTTRLISVRHRSLMPHRSVASDWRSTIIRLFGCGSLSINTQMMQWFWYISILLLFYLKRDPANPAITGSQSSTSDRISDECFKTLQINPCVQMDHRRSSTYGCLTNLRKRGHEMVILIRWYMTMKWPTLWKIICNMKRPFNKSGENDRISMWWIDAWVKNWEIIPLLL